MTALGLIQGTKPINQRMQKLIAKTRVPVTTETREQMAARADDLWNLHESMKRRPVS